MDNTISRPPARPGSGSYAGNGLDENEETDLNLKTVVDDEDNFRLHNQKLLLTYKTHIDKKLFVSWLKKKTNRNLKWIRIAHENADPNNPYEHSHVLVDFGKPIDTKNCRYLDYEDIHPHIQLVTTIPHWNNAKKYLGKEDPDNADLKQLNIYERVSECETIQDALALCKEPGQANGIVTLWNHRQNTVEKIDRREFFTRWQRQLYFILMKNYNLTDNWIKEKYSGIDFSNGIDYTDEQILELRGIKKPWKSGKDRKIMVIYDPLGCNAKTELGQACVDAEPKRFQMFNNIGSLRDVATNLADMVARGWIGETLFINIARTCEDHKIYKTIEAVRDGKVTVEKYTGGTCEIKLKYMVMILNFMPKLNAITTDRWDIKTIDQDGFLRDMHLTEAFDILKGQKNDPEF